MWPAACTLFVYLLIVALLPALVPLKQSVSISSPIPGAVTTAVLGNLRVAEFVPERSSLSGIQMNTANDALASIDLLPCGAHFGGSECNAIDSSATGSGDGEISAWRMPAIMTGFSEANVSTVEASELEGNRLVNASNQCITQSSARREKARIKTDHEKLSKPHIFCGVILLAAAGWFVWRSVSASHIMKPEVSLPPVAKSVNVKDAVRRYARGRYARAPFRLCASSASLQLYRYSQRARSNAISPFEKAFPSRPRVERRSSMLQTISTGKLTKPRIDIYWCARAKNLTKPKIDMC